MIIQLLIFFTFLCFSVICLQPSDFYVHDLPLLPKEASSIRMHAGHLPVDPEHHGALFFWHFASKYVADKSRTVIWLNGGPGCSSLTGAWMEIGPFRFQDINEMVENNGSWHLFTNLLFVDQPVGTGFSYIDDGSFIHELDVMANQFLEFLDRYIEIFPELLQNDIYLAGESFAGQFIPYIARAILEKRSILKLRGLLIGNGWVDPVNIYKSYLPFAVANNLVEKDSKLYNSINEQVKLCEQTLSQQVQSFEKTCYRILVQIYKDAAMNNHYAKNQKGRCVNTYDVRLDDTYPDCGRNWPPDLKYVTPYLHREDVISRIHVDTKKSKWEQCSDSVFFTFLMSHSEPSIKLLPDLLRQIPIVLYNGEYDLICNHLGTEAMIDTMTWNNGTGFNLGNGTLVPLESWIVDGENAGLIRTARNLTYILFYNASHMVPYNYARRSRVMLHQFIKLNSTFFSDETTITNIEGTNQTTHRTSKYVVFIVIVVVVIIIIMTLLGLVWFLVHKREQNRMSMPFSITRMFRSKHPDIDRQQSVTYSRLNEDLQIAIEETVI